jgi:1-deoxyxylulose-5-phosphate synthase
MLYPTLGRSGLRISQLALGAVNFGELIDAQDVDRLVATALEHGISTFDTADAYALGNSERLLGQALRGNRARAVICTKVGLRVSDSEAEHASSFRGGYDHHERWKRGISPNEAGLGRLHMLSAVEESLRRLGTDWIDLYQVHRWDGEVPLEETLRALDDLVRSGKVRYIGCSQYAATQMREAAALAGERGLAPFISMQQPYNMLNRGAEVEVMAAAQDTGMGLLTFQALAGGMLAGRYSSKQEPQEGSRFASRAVLRDRYWNDEAFALVEGLGELARQFDRRPEELAIGWNLAQPAVDATLIGASNPEDVIRNCAITVRPLLAEELAALQRLVAVSRGPA